MEAHGYKQLHKGYDKTLKDNLNLIRRNYIDKAEKFSDIYENIYSKNLNIKAESLYKTGVKQARENGELHIT